MIPDRFDLSGYGLAPRFPAVRIGSAAEFDQFRRDQRDMLDARYGYEQTLGSRDPAILRPGTCAPCLRPALFESATAQGDKQADGRVVPHWREAMRCDCVHGLINRQRALLHLMQTLGLAPWWRVGVFGPATAVSDFLQGAVAAIDVAPRLVASDDTCAPRFGLGWETASRQLVLSEEYLPFVPPLAAALAEIARALVPGGSFVFTVPFHLGSAVSVMMPAEALAFATLMPAEFRGAAHALGWDFLDLLRAAGFRDAAAYCYWSEELGYLGPFNLVFRATK